MTSFWAVTKRVLSIHNDLVKTNTKILKENIKKIIKRRYMRRKEERDEEGIVPVSARMILVVIC